MLLSCSERWKLGWDTPLQPLGFCRREPLGSQGVLLLCAVREFRSTDYSKPSASLLLIQSLLCTGTVIGSRAKHNPRSSLAFAFQLTTGADKQIHQTTFSWDGLSTLMEVLQSMWKYKFILLGGEEGLEQGEQGEPLVSLYLLN